MENRLVTHPIIDIIDEEIIPFEFNGKRMYGKQNEVISSALFANGIHIFGRHIKDNSPQGMFCANGQCSQCLVLVNGVPQKSCVTQLTENMEIKSLNELPELPIDNKSAAVAPIETIKTKVLIIGGGPAGLMVALEMGKQGLEIILADDKLELGGKLSLQTHNFFGSIKECFAGTRGMNIGHNLANEIEALENIDIWLNSPVVGVFCDKKVGIVKNGKYKLVKPEVIVNATGARENPLAFDGCDLPGIYGAGAFQTLVNRDQILPSKKLFVVGGGNVGLIVSYHAIQAGIEVLGLVEALPKCGGYKVHEDKLKRFGVPIFTSHTILKAFGNEHLESIIISEIDKNFNPILGTEKRFEVDTLLLAVGLSPVNELAIKAKHLGFNIYNVGDSEIISEASAAIFSGKIIGRKILKDLGYEIEIPEHWENFLQLLRKDPGKIYPYDFSEPQETKKYPVIRCVEKIPCNPCVDVCPFNSIIIPPDENGIENIMNLPYFDGKCVLCGKCVAICPGLAITLVDREYDKSNEFAAVILPYELLSETIEIGQEVHLSDFDGGTICTGRILEIKEAKWQDKRQLVKIEVPFNKADDVAGIKLFKLDENNFDKAKDFQAETDDKIIICRCERVSKGEIRKWIRKGYRDLNALKAVSRIGMGACGGKTCIPLIKRIFREEGIDLGEITDNFDRPFFQEVNLQTVIDGNQEDK